MKTDKDMANVIKVFGSVSEFDTYLQGRKNTKAWEHSNESQEEESGRGKVWYGTRNWEEAENLLTHGDRKNYEKIMKETTMRVQPQYRAQRQQYSAVVGCAPNVAAFVAGAPNAMIAQRLVQVKRKVVNIVYTATFTCGVSVDDIIRTSVAVLQKVVALEAAGTRVNLYMSHIMHDGDGAKEHYGFAVKIKDARQPMDVLKTVYPMVNASMLRRHAFRFWETTEGVKYCSGYGRPLASVEDYRKDFREAGIRDVVILSGREILASKNMAEAIEEAFK